jgi:hypothetical protein
MKTRSLLTPITAMVVGLALLSSASQAVTLGPNDKYPDPVVKTFKKNFPKGKIEKVDVAEENGVMVYDIEFAEGKQEKETDISGDGTMLEYTLVRPAKSIPAPVMKTMKEFAVGGELGRLEEIRMTYETKEGKVVKLPKMVTKYAAEIERGKDVAEVVVGSDGSLIEAPKWPEPAAKK